MIGICACVATAASRETKCTTVMAASAVVAARKGIRAITGVDVSADAAEKGETRGINGPRHSASVAAAPVI